MFIDSNQHFKYTENSCITVIYLHMYRLIIDWHNNLLPVGLIAQLVEHCNSIAEVRVQFPIQAFLVAAQPFHFQGVP